MAKRTKCRYMVNTDGMQGKERERRTRTLSGTARVLAEQVLGETLDGVAAKIEGA
jgi:hypothetical protein